MESLKAIQSPGTAETRLSGWGRYPSCQGHIVNPESISALPNCFAQTDGLLPRGMGRSYGDAAISNSSTVILTRRLNQILDFDEEKGILRCQPGLNFEELINTFLPRGWFPPVTPGTKYVTMGGALASDIHGKNHHKDGSFVNFVNSFKIICADGEKLNCSRNENSELFHATAGGMGLTGLISELELSLLKVASPYVLVKKIRCKNLAETYEQIEANEKDYPYSVSWIDCLAAGSSLGRSILILGKHADKSLDAGETPTLEARQGITIPFDMPSWILNRYSIGSFNQLYYTVQEASGQEKVSHFNPYFYPLDFLADWNRLYGKAGFIQYQCALPQENSKAGLEEILTLSSKRGRSSFLAVLKKFGKAQGLLSFPIPGYTLTLDMPVKDGLFEFTKELDEIVLKHGGRIYLAKDACLSAENFRKMYPALPEWLAIKRGVDPKNRFSSSLAERLQLK
ncbi:MAG: FAD-binding oxidoreductase [Candidatus Obscuribacterales bacterium]|nr:FAD-binding oxidoreductase [Candidatus Obscuribacterales bacterium]